MAANQTRSPSGSTRLSATLDRTADERGKCVVDNQRNTGLPRHRRHRAQIGDPKQRIRDRLRENHSRRRLHERLERNRARCGVEGVVLDARARQQVGGQGSCFSIDPIGNQRLVVLAQRVRKIEAIAPMPRRRNQTRLLAQLQATELPGENRPRVGDGCRAGVDKSPRFAAIESVDFIEIVRTINTAELKRARPGEGWWS